MRGRGVAWRGRGRQTQIETLYVRQLVHGAEAGYEFVECTYTTDERERFEFGHAYACVTDMMTGITPARLEFI